MKMIALALSGLLMVACTTHIPVRTQTDINVPVDIVYATLLDFKNYPDWNPYHIRVAGIPALGERLEVRVRRPDGKIVDVPAVRILTMTENEVLAWGGGIKGIFHGEHVFKLEKLNEHSTRLFHNEDFEGLFIGFADLPQDVLTEGYEQMNQALKRHLEKQDF